MLLINNYYYHFGVADLSNEVQHLKWKGFNDNNNNKMKIIVFIKNIIYKVIIIIIIIIIIIDIRSKHNMKELQIEIERLKRYY